MKRSPSNSSQPGLWTRLFRRREREKSHSSLGRRLRRALLLAGAALAALYLLGAFAGYAWMRYGRKNDQITFSQVALLRWRNVRRGVAVQQFAQGEKERAAGNYQAAYLAYVSGVRNDPDNIPGRLAAANLLVEANGLNMAVSLLEDGITRAPDSRPLLDRLFDLLTASGRDQRALDLLRRRPASQFSGANGPLLRTYEILATLNAEGAGPAKALLDRHPELEKNDAAAPVLARVLWESQQKLKAIDLLSRHVAAGTAPYSDRAQLAQWQLAAGLPDKALQTAGQACAKFPQDPAPRVLQIEMLATQSFRTREWHDAVIAYLKDFSARPEAVVRLADLAGRSGWLELTRALYEFGAVRDPNLAPLAVCYADALASRSRYPEAAQILAQLEAQGPDNAPLLAMVRQRQVILAAAQGDHDAAREAARRLATVLRGDLDRLELARRNFLKLGIPEAAAEFSAPSLTGKLAARK